MRKKSFLFLMIFFFISIKEHRIYSLLHLVDLNKQNRWFIVNPGFKLFLHGVDLDGKNFNKIKTSFDFGTAFDLEFPLHPMLSFSLEFSYLRQGGYNIIPYNKSLIILQYLALTQIFHVHPMQNLSVHIGFSHQLLLSATGKLIDPIINLSIDPEKILNYYNFSILLGIEYSLYHWKEEKVALIGGIKGEFGLLNILKIHKPVHQTFRFPIIMLGIRWFL